MSALTDGPLSEMAVVRLWREITRSPVRLTDMSGQSLTVLYAGRPNDRRGGDFRDAVILWPEGCRKGCIEIHTLTSGWQTHGHHRDPYFNQVVLQVAWKADRGWPALSAGGQLIPTVVLSEQSEPGSSAISSNGTNWPCRDFVSRHGSARLEVLLDQTGEQRFRQKSRIFQNELLEKPAEQVLYRGLAGSLGYSQNQKVFENLAERVPLRLLPDTGNPGDSDLLALLQSCLLSRAGLLPSQRGWPAIPDDYIRELERIRQVKGWNTLTPSPPWQLFRVRPLNYPVRRLIALSHWLALGRISHWQSCFLAPLGLISNRQALQTLRYNLAVSDPGYWARHYDFGLLLSPPSPVLLGANRLGEMLVNILLPFLLAWAESHTESVLARRIILLYMSHPALADNSIERHMSAQLAVNSLLFNTACRQQGLIHIYKTFCIEGDCCRCPLNG